MNKTLFIIVTAIGIITLTSSSCHNSTESSKKATSQSETVSSLASVKPLREKVLTAEEQKALTPDMLIQILREGNKRFMNNDLTARDHSAMVRNASKGQYPKAFILSCVDSLIPVEDVFDKGIGDLFVGRIAGNFVNEDLLGSMEFGCKVSGAKLIVVLSHESCGAIKSAIDDVKLGNITTMLTKIKPAVVRSRDFTGEKLRKMMPS